MQQANVWITFCTVSNKRSIIEVTKTFTDGQRKSNLPACI